MSGGDSPGCRQWWDLRPQKVEMKLHINWGHASDTQIRRVLVDAEGDTQCLIQHVGDVAPLRDTRKAFGDIVGSDVQ